MMIAHIVIIISLLIMQTLLIQFVFNYYFVSIKKRVVVIERQYIDLFLRHSVTPYMRHTLEYDVIAVGSSLLINYITLEPVDSCLVVAFFFCWCKSVEWFVGGT